ncbi:MAG: hypothetical protein JOZ19_13800 [Rubrobacter sp.]|nr:hypothetical protein [Rubrobacter sp.]
MTLGESYSVRPSQPEDLDFLEMLCQAAHRRPLSDPAISRYLEAWKRPRDAAVIASDLDDRRVGIAWYRVMPLGNRGYGDDGALAPEVVIPVISDCCGGSVATELTDGSKATGF